MILLVGAIFMVVLDRERRGRALTSEERVRFGALLREHDYPGARLVALQFAYKLSRSRAQAQDLMGRADLRLARLGWDPQEVSLTKRLCRLVWSEWTNTTTESAAARRAEEAFVRQMQEEHGLSASSVEKQAVKREIEDAAQARATAKLDKLRASFEKAGDAVNLLWLDYALKEETDLQKMAGQSGRDVTEFYRAADRRKRHTRRLIAAEAGVMDEEDA